MNNNLRLIRKARSAGFLLPLIVICGFLAGGLVIWQSWLLSGVINRVFLDGFSLLQVVPLLRWIVLIVFCKALFTFFNENLSVKLAVRLKNELRNELLQKINRLGPVFLKGEQAGELATTALQGLDALDAYFGQFLPQILLAALLPLTILVVIFPIDLLTSIVFLITAPLIPLFMILIGKTAEKQTRRQWKALTRLGTYFLDTLQGLSTLIMMGRSRDRAGQIREVSDQYRLVTLKVLRITFLSAFALELIATLSTALVAVEIGLRLLYSRIEFQQAFFILLIAPEFYLPLRNLSMRYHAGMNGLTAAKRVFDLFDFPEQNKTTLPTSNKAPVFSESFTLTFREVSYQYPGSPQPALQRINLEIHSGNHYALIGESGSGKSTLARLLMRWIEPLSGQIMLNGVDMRSYDAIEWRRWIAWMPQSPHLFNASLLENIRLMDETVKPSAVASILNEFSLDDRIINTEQGLNLSLMEEGSRLSGGEAHRIALARTLLKNAPFLVMDEPTAHLDLELENELMRALLWITAGRTSLTIAHRYATILNADWVFVLKNGCLVEQGSHQELQQLDREYFRLNQASGRAK